MATQILNDEYLGKFPIKDPAHITNLDVWEVPGMDILIPPRGSRPPVYARKGVSAEEQEFLDRIPPHARGDMSTLLVFLYFFQLRIECDLGWRFPRLDRVLSNGGMRLRKLLKWSYERIPQPVITAKPYKANKNHDYENLLEYVSHANIAYDREASREAFIESYIKACKNLGLKEEINRKRDGFWIGSMFLQPKECKCGETGCEGWKMVPGSPNAS